MASSPTIDFGSCSATIAAMEAIKRARHRAGLSLSDLATATGLHRMAIARAERPDQDVKASTVSLIAKALGVPVCELFDESGHERNGRGKAKA